MSGHGFRYRAFISYSHADEKWASWLHRSLETYRIPARLVGQKTEFGPVPAKLAPVFRDRDELASATDLGARLTAALEGAATLVVICSPASAKSHWVNEEILAYKRLGRSNRVFCLIVDGEPYSSGIPGQEDEECFPKALRFQISADGELTTTQAEPIAADARSGKDGKANARLKLIAGILGVGFDDLRQRELQRRNRRLAIVSSSAVAGMVFAIGLATTAVIARNEAEAQRHRAEIEAETARQTASFMIDLFAVTDPGEARGRSITAREILVKGAERISTDLSNQPRIQTSLMDTIGKVYTSLGLYSDATEMLEDAVGLRRHLAELPREELAGSLLNLANVVLETAQYDRAAELYQEALAVLATGTDDGGELRIDINAALAELYFRTGDYARAEPVLQQVLAERLKRFGPEDPSVAKAIEELGLNQFDQGNLEQAELRLREALDLRWRILGEEPHPHLAENLNNLALVVMTAGNYDEAESLYRDALAMNRRLYGESHPEVALSLGELGGMYRNQGNLPKAEASYREALAMQRDLLGDEHPEVARLMSSLAFIYHDKGSLDEAMALSTAALEIQRKILDDGHPNIGSTLAVLGRWQMEAGDLTVAESRLREALVIQQAALTPDHPDLAITRVDLAEVLLLAGDSQEALVQARLGEAALVKSLSESHWITAVARHAHGAALHAQGEFNAAEPLLRSSYEQLAADPAARPAFIDKARNSLVEVYDMLGMPAEAGRYQIQ
ncbi:MAG: toll/interleukin-1 receptor domain-containing protein [Haliea sp.]